jgi:hypothetical protein
MVEPDGHHYATGVLSNMSMFAVKVQKAETFLVLKISYRLGTLFS